MIQAASSAVNFNLTLPWPYDSQRGMNISGVYIYIDNSTQVRYYNLMLSLPNL
jgi:hypothetical protein